MADVADATTGAVRALFSGSSEALRALAFSPDGADLAIRGTMRDSGLAVWSWRTRQQDTVPHTAPRTTPIR